MIAGHFSGFYTPTDDQYHPKPIYGDPKCALGFHNDSRGYWGLPLRPPLERYYVLFRLRSKPLSRFRGDQYRIVTVDASTPGVAVKKASRYMITYRPEGLTDPVVVTCVSKKALAPVVRLSVGMFTHDDAIGAMLSGAL